MVISLSSIGTRMFHVYSPDHNVLHLEVSGYQARFKQVVSGQQFSARAGIGQHNLNPLEHVMLEFVLDAPRTCSSSKDSVRDRSIIRITKGTRHLKRAGHLELRNGRGREHSPHQFVPLDPRDPQQKRIFFLPIPTTICWKISYRFTGLGA